MNRPATRGETYTLFAGLVVAVVGGVAALGAHERQQADNASVDRARVAYINAANQAFTLRVGCLRTIRFRIIVRDEAWTAYRANTVIANDPLQSHRTRAVRRAQAAKNREDAAALEEFIPRGQRVVPGTDFPQFSCARQYPLPNKPPGV